MFDRDGDQILTETEIKTGLKFHKVNLLDSEWSALVQAMDQNGDKVLTMLEWQQCLDPRINQQKAYYQLMKDTAQLDG